MTGATLLGLDEFGRDHLAALGLAVAYSLIRATYTAALLIAVAGALAASVEMGASRILRGAVQTIMDGLESVPIYIWVLAGTSWAPTQGAALVALIFVLAGAPLAFNALRGVIRQIIRQPYYLAAIAMGAGPWRLARRHVLPNALPHTALLFLHIIGAAMAAYGAIGLFGFVNRTELDLGVFLLRGKEQAGFDLTPLLLTLAAYAVIFYAIRRTIQMLGQNA
jgi:peptide/nickel transport system permease protein